MTEPISAARQRIVGELTRRRVAAGLSPSAVGRRFGARPDQVLDWERGEGTPCFRHLVGWAGALGYTVKLEPDPNHSV